MALLTALSLEAARAVARGYGVELSAIEPLAAGSVNSNFRLLTPSGRQLFARVYEEQGVDGAERELELGRELARAGVPVAAPLARADGALLGSHAGKPVALFEWIDGDILCQGRVTQAACREVGRALAMVHRATGRVGELPAGRFRVEDLERRLDRVEREASSELARRVPELRALLARYSAARDPGLPRGLVHGDLFRDNVLWQGERIAALIDFESASQGAWAYDLAVTLHAWCYLSAFEPALVAALVGSYHAERPLEPRELAAFRTEAALAALRFAVTRITDYSMRAAPGERPVRDYRRFLARLQAVEAGAFDRALASL